MAAKITLSPPEPIKAMFAFEQNAYSTSIIVIRSFVLKNDQILLVEERSDGFWTLPGGFADPHRSELVIHFVGIRNIYTCIFYRDLVSGEAQPNREISDIDFFL